MNWPFNKRETISTPISLPTFAISARGGDADYSVWNSTKSNVAEQFKGEVEKKETQFPKGLGEEHPFDLKNIEEMYKKIGIVASIVDKYVDYIWGNRFKVVVENEAAQKILDDWIEDVNFKHHGKKWVREAILKGTGYLELAKNKRKDGGNGGIGEVKVLNANHMYIERDNKGNIIKIRQYVKAFKDFRLERTKDYIEFEPDEVAIITINTIGSCPYGHGVIYPAIILFDNLIGGSTELHTLIKRKAGAPIIATVGDLKAGIFPSQEQLDSLGAKFEWLNNKHEWAFGPEVKVETIDFGNFGAKFEELFGHDEKMISWATQVPEVILGSGRIPEGLATTQRETWQRTISSKQEDIEPTMEQKIFRVVLRANKKEFDLHCEVIWNEPSEEDKKNKVANLIEMLKNPLISIELKKRMQLNIAELLELGNIDDLELAIDEEEAEKKAMRDAMMEQETNPEDTNPAAPNNPKNERGKEENKPQPKVPGTRKPAQSYEVLSSHNNHTHKHIIEGYTTDYELHEWLNFNYVDFVRHINNFIDKDNFVELLAKTTDELKLGKLSSTQIANLKEVMKDGFNNSYSVKEFESVIKSRVNPSNAYYMKDGKKVLAVSAEFRSNLIARTEITRTAVGGSLDYYKEEGVEKVVFVSSLGSRTCAECDALNGSVYTIAESDGVIPVHMNCRCAFVPVVGVQ